MAAEKNSMSLDQLARSMMVSAIHLIMVCAALEVVAYMDIITMGGLSVYFAGITPDTYVIGAICKAALIIIIYASFAYWRVERELTRTD